MTAPDTRPRWWLSALIVVVALLATACSSTGSTGSTASTASTEAPSSGSDSAADPTATAERDAPATGDAAAPEPTTDPAAAAPTAAPVDTTTPGSSDSPLAAARLVPADTYRVALPPFDYRIDWERCTEGECAELEVPLDHTVANGPTIRLAIARVPAEDPSKRIGSLLVNFGGPGGEAVDGLASFANDLPQNVRDSFDIVGWDPRGTGDATPFVCPVPDVDDALHDEGDGFADDVEFEAQRRTDFEQCSDVGGFLDNIGSVTAVRDMDAIRQAVGDDQLTYIGYSYGTQLGWMYATLFPESTRALVLDAPVAPGRHSPEGWVVQLENFDRQLARWDRLCDAATFCAVANEGMLETVNRLRSELAASPLDLGSGQQFTEVDLMSAMSTAAYVSPGEFGEFVTTGIADLDNDDAGIISLLLNDDFSYDGYRAVTCADGAGLDSLDELEQYIAQRFDVSDFFAPLPDVVLCDEWTGRVQPLPEPDTSAAAPLLLIAGTEDAATPYEGALALADQIENGHLLTYVGGGHGAVQSNPCVDDIFAQYVVNLRLPEPGKKCFEGRGTIGVNLAGDGIEGPGLPVLAVGSDTPAEAAGLQEADVILSFAGAELETLADLPTVPGGIPIELRVLRDGAELTVEVTPVSPDWT